MTPKSTDRAFTFAISLSVLNHLGRNLYRNFITVLGEAISNAWDADANNVWIEIDKSNGRFRIWDDGDGMTHDDFQHKFLKIGYSKRKSGDFRTSGNRPFIGAKGIGKLALLSCAARVSIFSKTKTSEYAGGVIDNSGLDDAIHDDLMPDEYPLEELDFNLIADIRKNHNKGTIIVFEMVKDPIKNSPEYIRNLLALYFRFSVIDPKFTIHVDGTAVSINDLQKLSAASEFLWTINDYNDDYIDALLKVGVTRTRFKSDLRIKGFVATVEKPSNLKIPGTETRATIDLFVNGRLRETNIIRNISTQRIVESYAYGQIHFDMMDQDSSDPFTSSREGVVESDPNFRNLTKYLKDDFIHKLIRDWDRLRLERGKDGDDENPQVSKKTRKAKSLYAAVREEYSPAAGSNEKHQVDKWLAELKPDAEFNIAAYIDCFLSENLVRKFIRNRNSKLTKLSKKKMDELNGTSNKWKKNEVESKEKANISFDIRDESDALSYLNMDDLALLAEGSKAAEKKQSLWFDAISYAPIRNAVGHTALLTSLAKAHLNSTYQNIRERVKTLLKSST